MLKSMPQHLYHIQWSLMSQLSWKKSLLLTWKILGLLVNLLAADEKYPVLNRDNLTIPIQMQLYQKQKTFSQFSAGFLKSTLYFKYFEVKDNPYRFCISEITDSKNVVKKYLKRTVLEDPSTSSMVNVPNHFLNEPLLDSLITTKSIEF